MYSNDELKKDARFHLRGSWGYAILIIVIVSMVQGIVSSIGRGFSGEQSWLTFMRTMQNGTFNISPQQMEIFLNSVLTASIISGIIGLVVRIFFTFPFAASSNNWFIRNRETPTYPPLEMLLTHFSGNYFRLVGARAWEFLWLQLWSLPALCGTALTAVYYYKFLIPQLLQLEYGGQTASEELSAAFFNGLPLLGAGFVLLIIGACFTIWKQYSYAMNAFILADNPRIGYKQSLQLSIEMMKGNKFRLFILQLSFIGWFLLGMLACGVGLIVARAYLSQTEAEFYAALRSQAVASGLAVPEDFGFTQGPANNPFSPTVDPYAANWPGQVHPAYQQPQPGQGYPQQGPQSSPYAWPGQNDQSAGTAYQPPQANGSAMPGPAYQPPQSAPTQQSGRPQAMSGTDPGQTSGDDSAGGEDAQG